MTRFSTDEPSGHIPAKIITIEIIENFGILDDEIIIN
jgi:hypothetical protein